MTPRQQQAEERNEAVRTVLREALAPMTPSDIACKVRQPWCYDGYPSSAAISPVLKRIGAVSPKRGKWSLPA